MIMFAKGKCPYFVKTFASTMYVYLVLVVVKVMVLFLLYFN